MKRNHYGITVDSEKPTTGVFQTNLCEWLFEEAMEGIDLDFVGHCEECTEEYHDTCYEHDGSQTELIGFKQTTDKSEAWYWFPVQGIGYLPDDGAEYSAIVGEVYTQVVRSRWGIRCALCSPCYPGQGDADSPGEYLCYSLPPDVIGDGDPDKSRVFTLGKDTGQ